MNKKNCFAFGLGVFISISASPLAFAETVWAKGVTEAGGWVDVNKSNNNDSMLCWAAAASNIIDWWQSKADPSQIPAGTPQGVENIFDMFRTSFNNKGLGSNIGWKWYFGGCDLVEDNYKNDFRITDPEKSGRYWEKYVTETCGYESVAVNDPSWIPSGLISETASSSQITESLVETLKDQFERGYGVTLAIAPGGKWAGGHAITLWGMEYDGNNIKTLYVTDSDDGVPKLQAYNVLYSEIQHEQEIKDGKVESPAWSETQIYLDDYYGSDGYKLVSWGALALPYAIPEPSAFGLLAGLMSLALVASRRRRSR